jgi:hypothetical protein
MPSPEQHPITDEEARRLAKGLVRLFQTPLRVIGTRDFDESITTADMVRFGGMLLGGVNASARDHLLKEKNRQHIAKVLELSHQPDALEAYIFNLIKEKGEGAGDINEAIGQVEGLLSGPGADRKFLQKAIAEAMPKARAGRPTEFDLATDPGRFLVYSSELITLLTKFAELKATLPEKSVVQILDFLDSEDSAKTEILRNHTQYISEIMGTPEFKAPKAIAIKARILSDAITGRELFGWSRLYSIQRAAEFRRLKQVEPE